MSGFGRIFQSSKPATPIVQPDAVPPIVVATPTGYDSTPWQTIMKGWIGQPTVTGQPPTTFDRMIFSHTSYGPLGSSMEAGCAAGVSACLELAGYKSAHSARAADYIGYGTDLHKEIKSGCICVFQWASGEHHVTTALDGDQFLGANQDHKVKISIYDPKYLVYSGWPVKA